MNEFPDWRSPRQAAARWEIERRGLSHQELKNAFLLRAERLSKAQRMRREEIVAEESESLRESWRDLGPRLHALVERFEPDCSPGPLLREMLGHARGSVADSIAGELHEAWCEGLGARGWAREASRIIHAIDRSMSVDRVEGTDLEASCRRLCDHLHRHPTQNGPFG